MSGEGRKQGLQNKGDILEIQFEKSNWGKPVLLEGTFDDPLDPPRQSCIVFFLKHTAKRKWE
jgi:hypothetical protein